MTDTPFIAKNGIVANGGFTANSTLVSIGSISLNTSAVIVGSNYTNSTNFTGTSNNTYYVGSVSAANVVSNAQLVANLTNYQTISGLAANVALLASNSSLYANQSITNTFTIGTAAYHVSNGNMGIGTSSPYSLLHLSTNAETTLRLNSSSGSSWFIGNNTSAYNLYNESNTPMIFYTNGSEKMRIDSSGNMGIGTSNPSAPGGKINLVVNSGGNTIIKAQTTSTTGAARYDYSTGTAGSYIISQLIDNSGSPYHIFSAGANVPITYTDFGTHVWRSNAGATEYMRINSSGNVGIGTGSPSYLLDVNGTARVGSLIFSDETVQSTAAVSPTTAGAVGTYAMAISSTYPSFGDNVPGSALATSDGNSDYGGTTLSGTWKCMGYSSAGYSTLWLRIA